MIKVVKVEEQVFDRVYTVGCWIREKGGKLYMYGGHVTSASHLILLLFVFVQNSIS